MALSACPASLMASWRAYSGLLLAFWLDVAWAVAPTQEVSNVHFEDTNGDGGWLSGTITWDPPEDLTGIHHYAVVIFNSMSDISPKLPATPGDLKGAWYLSFMGNVHKALVGTSSLSIHALIGDGFPRRGSTEVQPHDRRRYVWSNQHPGDRYIAVVCVSEDAEHGPAKSIPIYDLSTQLPHDHLDSVSFTDTNADLGVLSGTISWSPSGKFDFTLTKYYSVYLADDEVGTSEEKVSDVDVPTLNFTLSGHSRNKRDFIRIRGANTNGVSAWAKTMRLFDLGPSVPNEGVSGLAFTDLDTMQGLVAGHITWTPPDDEAPISSYRIFLSDQPGNGGHVMPQSGYSVPVGTNSFALPFYPLQNAPETGKADYIQVYTVNDKGMQALPTELAIVDLAHV
jgi:hypothetical protein